MGIFNKKDDKVTGYKMITTDSRGFFSYDGKLYKSEIIRSTIRPEVTAIGKLTAKHLRETVTAAGRTLSVNPEPYMRFLLEEPNPYMTGQDLQEKLATQLALNGNAFAMILRDDGGMPVAIYPIPANSADIDTSHTELMLSFTLKGGTRLALPYRDVIHIKRDYGDSMLFGTSPTQTLLPLMEMVTVIDQGLINAIKNSGVIRWLLKFTKSMRTEDIKTNVQEFAKNYLTYDSGTMGAIGTDSKADVERVEPKDYVPNAAIQDRVYNRIFNFFNTNQKIVQSIATEEEWDAFYEEVVEPVAIKLSNEFTRKLFSRRQRGHGNRIFFEAGNLQHASIKTKLNLREMVDRGAMTPNEWREAMNYAPIEGGDRPLRRKDTGLAVEEGEDDEN
jgi:HK97 family phage portal protein